jgi:hypothetical protein
MGHGTTTDYMDLDEVRSDAQLELDLARLSLENHQRGHRSNDAMASALIPRRTV